MEKEFNTFSGNEPAPVEQIPQTTKDGNEIKIKISIVEKWKEIMKIIKDKTGIDGIYIICFLLLCIILVYIGILGSLITKMIATLYPGFCTIKSLQNNKNKKEYLTYWVIYGCFIIFDKFSNLIIKIVPFYFILKILFLIWMIIPGSNGVKIVYNFIILKLFRLIENTLDYYFSGSKALTNEIIKKTKIEGNKKLKVIQRGLKALKEFGLGKKRDMAKSLKSTQELKNEKSKINSLYRKEFYSDIVLPSNRVFKKKDDFYEFSENLNEIEDMIDNNKNKHNDIKIFNVKFMNKNENKRYFDLDESDDILEFSDEFNDLTKNTGIKNPQKKFVENTKIKEQNNKEEIIKKKKLFNIDNNI